jgi:hypothetical protein
MSSEARRRFLCRAGVVVKNGVPDLADPGGSGKSSHFLNLNDVARKRWKRGCAIARLIRRGLVSSREVNWVTISDVFGVTGVRQRLEQSQSQSGSFRESSGVSRAAVLGRDRQEYGSDRLAGVMVTGMGGLQSVPEWPGEDRPRTLSTDS